MQQTRSMISLFAFLAAIFMATTCVDAAKLPVRQTNADRLRRNLGPLAPVKRTPTPILAARQAAASAGTTQGRAEITLADGTVLGHLSADDPCVEFLVSQICVQIDSHFNRLGAKSLPTVTLRGVVVLTVAMLY